MQFEETAIKRGSGWKTIKGTEVTQSDIDKISPKGLVHKLETKQQVNSIGWQLHWQQVN